MNTTTFKGPSGLTFLGKTAAIAGILACPVLNRDAQAILVADSVLEFSGVQGQDNWFYGYYIGSVTPSGFNQFTKYGFDAFAAGTTQGEAGYLWYLDGNTYQNSSSFTRIGSHVMHGQGTGPTTSPSGAITTQHLLSSRRWVSEATGTILIEGGVADWNPGSGDGATLRIFNAGLEVFSQFIPNTGSATFSFSTAIGSGNFLEFVADPGDVSPGDAIKLTAKIYSVPAPPVATPDSGSSLALLSITFAGMSIVARRGKVALSPNSVSKKQVFTPFL